jgi:putative peptidoglycan lipid II flippase
VTPPTPDGGGADALDPLQPGRARPGPQVPPPIPPESPDPAADHEAAAAERGTTAPPRAGGTRRGANLVAAGILLSRFAGLIRENVFARFFGVSLYTDAFRAALRMPNALQNLLGEGTLSASFIPVYSELLEQGRREEAGRVAGAVFALLLALAGALSLIGVALAPVIVSIFSAGFRDQQRELTIACVRIIFPMTGLLVLSAWALGILNSHRRFFVPYVAPVLWNAAMIATMLLFGGRMDRGDLVIALSWGAFLGGALQFAIQLPWVLRLEPELRVRWDTRLPGLRTAARNAGPAILGRGVVQLSGYVDVFLASWLAFGAVGALGFAQTLYVLPISLFGMSVAAAELPELSRERGQAAAALRERVNGGLRRIAVFVVPSFVGFVLLGDIIVAGLFQGGDFGRDDTVFVYVILAGYSIGLLASTATRLFSSAFFALQDTRTPARVAILRVVVAGVLGAALMLALRRWQVAGHGLGALGLALAASVGSWLEWALLRRNLRRRLEGDIAAGRSPVARMLAAAIIAALLGRAILLVLPEALMPDAEQIRHIAIAAWVLGPFGIAYFLVARALGVREAAVAVDRVVRRLLR